MRKSVVVTAVFFLFIGSAAVAHADLDMFMADLNVQARADMDGFGVRISSQFGVPVPEVRAVIKAVATPADAFMCFQLGLMTDTRPEVVVETYQRNKGKGWGVIAQELGIKPGSPEFHALKRGEFALTGKPGGGGGGKGGPKGKGKGHNK